MNTDNKALLTIKRIGQSIRQTAYDGFQFTKDRVGWLNQLIGDTKKSDVKALPAGSRYSDHELDEKEGQLALANALSRIILSTSDLDELCEGFAGEIRELVSIDWAAIGLIDKFTDIVRFSPLSDNINSTWDLGDTIPIINTPVEWMAKNQQALLEADLTQESQFQTGMSFMKLGLRSVVYMPLFSRREVFGGLIVGNKRPNAYGERELKLLKYTTTQLAIAIENSRLFRESSEGIERQTEFIATLTHELKTPLTPIRASGTLLAEELQQDKENPQAKLAENILRSAHVLDNKLSYMLDLAKVQSPAFKLQTNSIDIRPLIQDIEEQFQSNLKPKDQSLKLDIPSSLPTINADEGQIKRIILNLLLNAALITPQYGTIDLKVIEQNTELVIGVTDSGDSFSPEDQQHLFEVYYTYEVDRQRPIELRLRLAICKRLVELHKGKIWIDSSTGKGNTFTFSIPLG